MIPIIYPSDATTFKRRGYGALSDCISCSVTEVLNGEYSLELRYPKNGVYQEYLLVRNIIVCSANHVQSLQAFRIYKVNRSLNNYIVVYAYQWSYDLSGYVFYTAPLTIRGGLESTLQTFNSFSSHFVISTDKTSSAPFTIDVPSSVRSWFGGKEGSLIDVYGGEWYFDFDVCQLLSRRGSDSGVRISYGVNIAQYVKEITDNAYSEVYGYWAKEDDNGQLVVVTSGIWETGVTSIHRTLCLDITDKFEEKPTSNQVATYVREYVNSHDLTGDNQTITIEPSILKTEVGLGDTVHVCYDDAVVDTRVVQTVWDSLSERYTKLVLGTVKENIAETIKALGVSSSSGGSGGSMAAFGYGTCSTAAATTAKTVALPGYALAAGSFIAVRFTYAVPASATLNVNSTGAKSIYWQDAAITAGVINAGNTCLFIYDGSYYRLLSIDTNLMTMWATNV